MFTRAAGRRGCCDRVPAATRVQLIEHELHLSDGARERGRGCRCGSRSSRICTSGRSRRRGCSITRSQLLAQLAPDVLVLGGDYVFLDVNRRDGARAGGAGGGGAGAHEARGARQPRPLDASRLIERALERAGCRVLVNDAHAACRRRTIDFAIVGIDEPWTGARRRRRAPSPPVTRRSNIAVSHAPEGLPFVEGRGAKLLLCGHTHGGQIALPRGPVVVHGPLGRRWPSGLHHLAGMDLFVSRGIGMVDVPLRAYAPSDVSLFTLR